MLGTVAQLLATISKPLLELKKVTSQANDVEVAKEENKSVQLPSVSDDVTPSVDQLPGRSAEDSQDLSKSNDNASKLRAKPPLIPPTSLKSIANILTAGECPSKTFLHVINLIQHLSHLSDSRKILAEELKSRAEALGRSIESDLKQLTSSLEEAKDSSEVPGVLISRFSSGAAEQSKLLRLLKTLDLMFTEKPLEADGEDIAIEADSRELRQIHETFRFGPLWEQLSRALAVIENKTAMDHIANVLLPLIEALMVVSRHAIKKVPQNPITTVAVTPSSPRSPILSRAGAEDLFAIFTDSHRKLLNLMVRNNPSLMSGSFSLMVNNPKVLDFDNKRNYFTQQLRKRPQTREHHSTLQVNVRRQHVFEDSFRTLHRKSGDQIKYGKLSIRFYNEEGVDAGGVTREWFSMLARQMFNPDYALFQPCAGDNLTYQPNRSSAINPEHLDFFKFVGRLIGKAIFDGRLLEAYFAKSLYRQVLGKPVDYRDVEWVDPEYYNSLCWILENDPSVLEMNFTVEADEFGLTRIIDLKPNGVNIPVTNENKREFVQLSARYRLYSSIKDQIEAFLKGFYEIIPKDLVSIFNEQEVELLISGTPDIDIDEWRAATEYHGYGQGDPVIAWWWRALKSFNRDERAKVLSFATGTSRVPLGGFGQLQGVQGVQKFSIHRAYGDPDRLPQAHTCFNQIDLPSYSSYEKLRTQLLLAINEGGEGFGFA